MKRILLSAMALITGLAVHAEHQYVLHNTLDSNKDHYYTANSHIILSSGFKSEPRNGHEVSLTIDSYLIEPPSIGITGGPLPNNDGVVGSLGGTVDVSRLGGAVYRIPIDLPEGLGGIKPQLSICYNSQTHNGLLGWGWDLLGISSITRTGGDLYHDGYISAANHTNDRFSLDGQRLMAVGNGAYGSHGKSYRTEQDQLSKIVSYHESGINGPSYFKVWTADGKILYYGYSTDSKALKSNNYVNTWLLKRVEDRYGNTMEYHYHLDANSYRLESITYSGNDLDNINPAFTINFIYDKRDDIDVAFVGDCVFNKKDLLKEITVMNRNSTMFSYRFTYQAPNPHDGYSYHLLTKIQLFTQNEHLNPTTIQWGGNNYFATSWSDIRLQVTTTNSSSNALVNTVKFCGDFNNDGYSDIVALKPTNGSFTSADVFLNKGVSESLVFDRIQSFQLDPNVSWVQVADLDGDGYDDIIFSNRRRLGILFPDIIDADIYLCRMTPSGEMGFYHHHTTQSIVPNDMVETHLIGDFFGEGKCSILIQAVNTNNPNDHTSLLYTYDENDGLFHCHPFGTRLQANRFFPADYNGDGITEILYKKGNGATCITQLKKNGETYQYSDIYNGYPLDWSDCFPGDFNGDGLMDALFYSAGDDPWSIRLSNATGFSSLCYTLPKTFPYDSPGDYLFSLDRPHYTSHYIKIADLDGNGCSDLALYDNDRFYVFYGPMRTSGTDAPFSNSQYLSTQSFNLYDNMNVCIGNFLGKENQAYLGGATISRLPTMTLRHEVNRITDGMGRKTEFAYDYLTPNPHHVSENDFYQLYATPLTRSQSIRCMAIPIRALKKVTTYNIKDKPLETRCYYECALLHIHGKGFLGFSKTRQDDYINNQLHKKTIRQYDLEYDEPVHLMLTEERVFNNDAELMASATFYNFLYTHQDNDKIFIPMSDKTLKEFDVKHPEQMLKKEIYKTSVSTHCPDPTKYNHILSVTCQTKGITDNPNCFNPNNCEFQETTYTTYEQDALIPWIINRPATITKIIHRQGDDDICQYRAFTYNDKALYQVQSTLDLPNNGSNSSDRLALATSYQYDPTGNVISTIKSTPNDTLEQRQELFEYSKDYGRRLLTKHTDASRRETLYRYDPVYNYCNKATDHNGLVTHYEQDPFGITNQVCHPDGTKSYKTLRWNNNGYQVWEKKTGQPTKTTCYSTTGEVLQKNVYDLQGALVMSVFEYDDMGRIVRSTKPYRLEESPRFTRYEYNKYNQISKIIHADGTYETLEHDGNTKSTAFVAHDGTTQTESKTFNIMEWVVESTDAEGNSVIYDYYPDGKTKWMQIQGHDETRIEMTYDGLGNRTSLNDPNYGPTTYEYNAFNQMVKQVSPKNDETYLFYDLQGNLVKRIESNKQNGSTETTAWYYGQEKGQYGLLTRITTPNQTIDYSYDGLCRLNKTTEQRWGEVYQTKYTYDKASRLSMITYPSQYSTKYCYTSEGYLKSIMDASSKTLWKTSESNAMMQPTKIVTGNGYVSRYEYDKNTDQLLSINTALDETVVQDYKYHYDDFSNMTFRSNGIDRTSETFTYDPLNRLTSACDAQGTSTFSYDPLGRMISKTSPDGIVFSNADYTGEKPHAIKSAQVSHNIFPQENMSLVYTSFDKVRSIQEGINQVVFDYGHDHQRIRTTEYIDGKTRTKKYVGNCEFISGTGIAPTTRTFLQSPSGVFAVVETVDGVSTIHYIHKDHLGSWTTISDAQGNIEQTHDFDAWGNHTNADNFMFDRGFTGHEHIQGMGLINMNGRIYDPVTSSMLSPDNDIQMPGFSQNFNRYSYCINNPLSYTDPDGNTFLETALVFYLLYCTDYGYELQKFLSPVAFHIDLHLSSQQLGFGFDVSFGVPKDLPFSFRAHGGATLYCRFYDNFFSGMEFRAGLELYAFGILGYSGTSFYNGSQKQTTNMIILGNANWGISYENDYMFHIGDYILGGFAADNGDRYRSAAAKIRIGPFVQIGVNLFTGDPGVDHKARRTYYDPDADEGKYYDSSAGGRMTYTTGENGENPDEYRAGVFYIGFGPFRIGGNSESIRNIFQNHFAHDFLCKGDSPYFRVLDRDPQVYFYFGTGTGNTLW